MPCTIFSFGKDDRLRVDVLFEKEVDPFATLTIMIRAGSTFLIAGAVVAMKFLVVTESVIADSRFDSVVELQDLFLLKASLL